MKKPKREELAWAAGFFDGEGNTHASAYTDRKRAHHKRSRRIQVAVFQNDLEPLERFQKAVLGLGKIYQMRKGWLWSTSKFSTCQTVIALLWNFLSSPKRKQAADNLTRYINYDY